MEIADGDFIIENELSVRISNGLLNDIVDEDGNVLPAIETSDGSHVEHWHNGLLHCENGPAVIDIIDDYEEWWNQGRRVLPEV